ncbi:MAG: fatty acid desaturase [Chitinophagales bacterium]|nr:fatty acid desaturase [Chitinophagales bacterium]
MRPFPEIIDPRSAEKKELNAFDLFWIDKIRDKRDLILVYFTFRLIGIFIPLAILLFLPLPKLIWAVLAIFYTWMNVFRYKSRFTLMMHITSHRPWFKTEYNYLNKFLPWILGPFMGQSPEAYFSHHIGMHHLEANLEDDDSSTMNYQRDSKADFARYLLGFLFFGVFRLTAYFNKKNRPKLRNNAIIGEALFFFGCIALSFINLPATLVVFIIPFITTRVTMMLGNWSQHSFVDADDPANEYKSAITIINHKFNSRCWNDGYHISHHIKPALHWTEHPSHLMDNKQEYADNGALVFEGIEFGGIWFKLMKKDYEGLASHVVNINGMYKSDEEVIAIMKERTKKIAPRGITMDSIRSQNKAA